MKFLERIKLCKLALTGNRHELLKATVSSFSSPEEKTNLDGSIMMLYNSNIETTNLTNSVVLLHSDSHVVVAPPGKVQYCSFHQYDCTSPAVVIRTPSEELKFNG
ncbi:hypothetical protein HSE3_gp128 [Bacillus phage vB_BceM-HSE3]|nr:hypothetical protein HSE3_gp128 [Bacillus phage vB_BceM-HSE3]